MFYQESMTSHGLLVWFRIMWGSKNIEFDSKAKGEPDFRILLVIIL